MRLILPSFNRHLHEKSRQLMPAIEEFLRNNS